MMDKAEEAGNTLEHVHMCMHCSGIFRREEYESRALTSGIYLCPRCGLEGPLNVVIRKVGGRARENHHSPERGLAR
jgi:hypothetical protein